MEKALSVGKYSIVLCMSSTLEMMFPCVSMTPFGSPMVPEVKSISRRSARVMFSSAAPCAYFNESPSMDSMGIMCLSPGSSCLTASIPTVNPPEAMSALHDENDIMNLWLSMGALASSGTATAPIHDRAKRDIPHSGRFSPSMAT